MGRQFNRKLILENGEEFLGYGFGGSAENVCELVFNTSMMGYQDVITDPAYTDMAVLMTYPLIGNYGIADDDFQTKKPSLGALIVGENNDFPSNFRFTKTLSEVLEEYNIPGIEGFDTRMLTKKIRGGIRTVLITDNMEMTPAEGMEIIAKSEVKHDAVSRTSCRKRWLSRTTDHLYNIVVVDCGAKPTVVRTLNELACNVTVVPYDTTAEQILALKPHGVVISDGPGSPDDVPQTIEAIRSLKGKLPMFGLGLGLQLICLAYGARSFKMQADHRGSNHPIKDLITGTIEVEAQNHGYAIDASSIEGTGLEITHINLLDKTVEGVRCIRDKVIASQFRPSTVNGPQNRQGIYDRYISLVKENKENA